MKNFHSLLVGILYSLMLLVISCQTVKEPQAPISLTWEMGTIDVENPAYYDNTFVLQNVSQQTLDNDWSFYYCQLPRGIEQPADAPVKVELVNGNYFRVSPTAHYQPLAPGETLRIDFRCKGRMDRYTLMPEGAYWVGSDGKAIDLLLDARRFNDSIVARYPDAATVYATNAKLPAIPALLQSDIIPSVKQALPLEGSVKLADGVSLLFPEQFAGEAALLKEKLATQYAIQVREDAPVTITFVPLNPEEIKNPSIEAYIINITDGEVKIAAATAHGIFNGTQTLLAMLKGKESPYELQGTYINDYPDMHYRGVMIDIVRNYTSFENLKRFIDILASYKVNTLQFHFNDDEGWRLEIPGLPELTEVAGRRGHTTDESDRLYPSYAGGSTSEPGSLGSGYYTRSQFIELLQYAAARHIHIIPELETPGHARGAIVAMKARYNKYISTDPEKAMEYMLIHPEDTSEYLSVQSYSTNVIDVAMPSTYRFIEKVVTEMKKMYEEAGLQMTFFHLGGDEVAAGAWKGSPACQQLIKEKGMTKRHDLAEYYITKAANILAKHGVKLNGWQEVAIGHSEAGHRQLTAQAAGINCWTAVPDWNTDGVVYEIANNGYPVVLSNVCNFYMDMAYSYHPGEPGLNWGGCVDETRSFSALPFRNYRSSRWSLTGTPFDMSQMEKDKPALTEEGRKNMIGVSAQFFAETLRGYEWLEYHFFPKYMGVAERGWHAHPAWEKLEGAIEEETFQRELAIYELKIAEREMPHWATNNINFHVAFPGLKVENGLLLANCIVPGAEIRYTLDGSEPTAQSTLWTAPVKCDAQVVKAKAFYQGKESQPITYRP
ncbi:MAG: glycosyl hydrolase family 20 [Mediterranea massiliensis]|nr:glycosyl hydrolase family 20 [Mediterranea massiliensis]